MPTTNYHWSSVLDCVMHETDGAGTTTVDYTHEPTPYGPLLSERRAGAESIHHYDALGSTTALTDEAGDVTDAFQYDAWGNAVARAGTTPTSYQWNGRWGYQRSSVANRDYVRARVYTPNRGRWLSIDIYWDHGMQRYAYGGSRPVFVHDPTGEVPLEVPLPQTEPPRPEPGRRYPTCCLGEQVIEPPKCSLDPGYRTISGLRDGRECQIIRQLRRGESTWKIGKQFVVGYRFSNLRPAVCSCCEVRQFVSGRYLVRYKRQIDGAWNILSERSRVLPELEEDCAPFGVPGCRRYGHRTEPDSNSDSDRYLNKANFDERLTGCRYQLSDSPGAVFFGDEPDVFRRTQGWAEMSVELDLRFVQVVLDVCQDPVAVIASDLIDLQCDRTF